MADTDSATSSGLPVDNPCLSFWQQTTRSFPHLNANQNASVPPTAPYVVIGSGISGALTAYELIQSGIPGKDIVILEAREAASGASSRNAGHVRPDAFRGFQVYARLHGPTQALKILTNERTVFERVSAFVKTNEVPCDFNPTTTLDVCLTPAFADFNAASFAAYRDAGGNVSHVTVFDSPDGARTRTGIEGAVSAYEWPAGSIHPAKLAQWLLARCVDAGAKLFTHCPATAVERKSGTGEAVVWNVVIPRGTIATPTVVHCTNAFMTHLLPDLAPFVTPMRAQAHAIVPPPELSSGKMIGSTMSLRQSLHHFYSVAQRPADGIIVLGCSRGSPNISREAFAARLTSSDRTFNEEVRDDALKSFEACFPVCEPKRLRHGEGLSHVWTGIIGMTTDSVPFVGKLEGLPGQWVCAGFNGHGMARIFTCAPGVVKLMRGGTWEDTGLPECFELTSERLEKMKKGVAESVF